MSFLSLFLLLRRNMKLSNKRNPMFEVNIAAKIFMFIGTGVMSIYLIVLGTMLGWSARGGDEDIIFIVWPFILLFDFVLRWGSQQTPSLLIKPYLLMPIPKKRITDSFIIMAMCSSFNLIWLPLLLPFSLITFCGGVTFGKTIGIILVCQLLVIINALWYMLVRTLVNQKIWWWILPVAVYGAMCSPMMFMGMDKGFDAMLDFIYIYAYTPPAIVLYIIVAVLLFTVNSFLQVRLADSEIAAEDKQNDSKILNKLFTSNSDTTFLKRFGIIGEYLSIEIKSALRNKAIRQRYLQGIAIIIMLSLMLAYTDIYSGTFAVNMWCLYCFVFFAAVNLAKVMGPEGNYIDLLMVHNENILALLRAKYYFFCAVLVLPLLLLIPPVISGRFSILMILAYLFITSGLEHFILFQLAVYNKQSLPLNEKVTSKGNFENTLQLVIELIAFFLPVLVVLVLSGIFGETTAYIIMIVIGLAFTFTHHIWLRNIYNRMMKRRYENMEGFHATR